MRNVKKGLLIGAALFCMPMLTACSFRETLGILWNSEDKEEAEDTKNKVQLEGAEINPNVEKPVINNEMGEPVTYDYNAEAEALVIDAAVSDGGTLSYQWYRNNVDSNGGGTPIEGAVESTYTPPTDVEGTSYYYAVVTNTLEEGIQLTTSGTKCVTVNEAPAEEVAPEEAPAEESAPEAEQQEILTTAEGLQGSWVSDEVGKKFQYTDGNFAVSKWETINNERYVFDENGYLRVGWYQEGENWFYLDGNGVMLHDTQVEGYTLGSDGVRQAPAEAPAQ